MNMKVMTCEAYYTRYLSGTEVIQEMLEEARSSRVFSAKRIFGRIVEEAALDAVALSDKETFDYDLFFRSLARAARRETKDTTRGAS